MIEKHDGEFEILRGNPPQHVTFLKDTKEVGCLHFGPPMRFEGNAEESAQIFFDYVVQVHNDRLHKLTRLLEAAKCPDEHCDGNGTCATGRTVPGYDGEGDVEWDVWQCQWCDERKKLLGEADNV